MTTPCIIGVTTWIKMEEQKILIVVDPCKKSFSVYLHSGDSGVAFRVASKGEADEFLKMLEESEKPFSFYVYGDDGGFVFRVTSKSEADELMLFLLKMLEGELKGTPQETPKDEGTDFQDKSTVTGEEEDTIGKDKVILLPCRMVTFGLQLRKFGGTL